MNIRIGQNTASFPAPSLNAQEFDAQISKQEVSGSKINIISPKFDKIQTL